MWNIVRKKVNKINYKMIKLLKLVDKEIKELIYGLVF